MNALLKSRKFWVFLVTGVIDLASYFGAKYAGIDPKDLTIVLGFVNGLAAVVIAAIYGEDAAALKAGTHPNQLPK